MAKFLFESQASVKEKESMRLNSFESKDGRYTYYFGIIDILTQYGLKKKMEHGFKMVFQGSEISCYPPEEYAERFCAFMNE